MTSLHFYKRHQAIYQITRSTLTHSSFSTATSGLSSKREEEDEECLSKNSQKWVTLPPYSPKMSGSLIGQKIMGRNSSEKEEPISALKWVKQSCPYIPISQINKLFRLRQVRKEFVDTNGLDTEVVRSKAKRVKAKGTLVSGDVILLPLSVEKHHTKIEDFSTNEIETNFIRSLVLYKDPAIIVINKPQGMAVQGGVGIKHCIDTLASTCLKYDFAEPPKLVHRLDRESSGILVLGRTQTSASIMHSIFREKTSGVKLIDNGNIDSALEKKYWALVIGTPKHSKGIIDAPLAKMVLEDGQSDRITIPRDKSVASQHALTEYKVIKSAHGYSWLELRPVTGRKHQIRVHCAEVLGTPIVGDYKYGWKAHKSFEPIARINPRKEHEKLPFGLESGRSVHEKQPHLHLHCRQMKLPNIFNAMQQLEESSSSYLDISKLDMLEIVAPVTPYMKESWEALNC